ncbi:D-alanyl-D-alanine carboxypeptidase [Salsuginibacillus halophilus]|uniref:D-alanyl-D-alanine carboxypeptidase n=1 Tax=Salsuginibacillus halophilus TaxID=517424 RepID=A0A2P8HW50_9BACI|nr:D-alanyl-D-alanine carboxypeptidase family protein [Salsuginibacillus halophilus]PSL50408.1 D-alanyl-D-alanine carboxypeptidase [Salsuginibacillus halophilus]
MKTTALCLLSLLLIYTAVLPAETASAVSAESAVVMEQESGRVLYGKDETKQMRIASITKIMTAVVALEEAEIDDMVQISQNAAGTEGSSLYLEPGDEMKLEDLLYGLMLRSGNDAAVAIAEHAGETLDGFVYLMNKKAEEIGMAGTRFQNPHGLDDHEEHHSTAFDMALLTRYAMNNEEFREISGTTHHSAPNEREAWDHSWKNKNKLLTGLYEHATGGKTGYTKRAKRTLVSTAEKNDTELIAVTLNAPSDWNDHIQMFETAFAAFQPITLAEPGKQPVLSAELQEEAYVHDQVTYPLNAEEQAELTSKFIRFSQRDMAHRGDGSMGRWQFMLDGEVVAEAKVYREEAESPPTFLERINRLLRMLKE